MANSRLRRALRGRVIESEALDRLLEDVRSGRSATLVVRGEAGVGKTALLDDKFSSVPGLRVATVVGVESEMELPFAGMHQLCGQMLDGVDRLPDPQRGALHAAFGMAAGASPDRFFVGLAVLSLLSGEAEQEPLLCVVDDAQWLDRASSQALAFVARRLVAESVGIVFSMRKLEDDFVGLPELVVEGLDDEDSRALLHSVLGGPMDPGMRDWIVAETRGNPLALLEFPRGLTMSEMAGGFGLPGVRPLSGRIEESFASRVEALPGDTQRLLLVAAAEQAGDAALLWQAAKALGIDRRAAAVAEDARLIEFGPPVRFRHPLVRSAVYRVASIGARQEVHRALADATDGGVDPDRRAWYGACATSTPDESVAAELEQSAGRAQTRGGIAAAAAFLERAEALTVDPELRASRLIAAAEAKLAAGAPDDALRLISAADSGPHDDLQRARLERLRARVAFGRSRGSSAPPVLLTAARRLQTLDPLMARDTYLEALGAAILAGRSGGENGVAEAARAALDAPDAPEPPRAVDLLLDGLATRFTDGYEAGVKPLGRALSAFLEEDARPEADIAHSLACRVAPDLWDDETWYELTSRQARVARDTGALSLLPIVATYRAGVHVHAGEFAAASELIHEADVITDSTGNTPFMYTSLVLAAWRGDEAHASELINASVTDATLRGEGRAISLANYAAAVLNNGLGEYRAALDAAEHASLYDDLGLFAWAQCELVEAAARSDEPDLARTALNRLSPRTRAAATNWALGTEARSRALLSVGAEAESLYQEALKRLARSRMTAHLARAHLVYGEWLRRERRRSDARVQLRSAHGLLEGMGARAFALRAERELLATGEHARKRSDATRDDLTPQESQIARLARDGLSNPEIGAQLFISPRTVQYHLHKVFTKLAINSRTQLHLALPADRAGSV
jgi:DNA-binding CsgD family transcriptional regulator